MERPVQTPAAAAFLDAKAAAAARDKAYKAKQERLLDEELATMRQEREALSVTAERITAELDEFEFRFAKAAVGTAMNKPTEKMDKLLSEMTESSRKAFASLEEASANFEAMRLRQQKEEEELADADLIAAAAAAAAVTSVSDDAAAPTFAAPPADSKTGKTTDVTASFREKLSQASEKLNKIFHSGKAQYDGIVLSMTASFEDSSEQKEPGSGETEQALIPMLSKKVEVLTKALELSQLKAQALGVQWLADKMRYEDVIGSKTRDLDSVQHKLVLQDSRNRLYEQIQRDPNMVSNVVTKAEHDALKKEKLEIEKELQEKSQLCAQQRIEISTLSDEAKKDKAELEQLTYKLEQLSSQVAGLERKVELSEDRLKREVQDYEAKISGMLEQAKEQAARIRENDKIMDSVKQQHAADLGAKDEEFRGQIAELQKQAKRKVLEMDALQNKLGASEEKAAKRESDLQDQVETVRSLAKRLQSLDATQANTRADLERRVKEQTDRVKNLSSQCLLLKQAVRKGSGGGSGESTADAVAAAAAKAEIDKSRAIAQAKAQSEALNKARAFLLDEARSKQRVGESQTEATNVSDAEVQASIDAPSLNLQPFSVEVLENMIQESSSSQEQTVIGNIEASEPFIEIVGDAGPMEELELIATARNSSPSASRPLTASSLPESASLLERSKSLNLQLLDLVERSADAVKARFATGGDSAAVEATESSIVGAIKGILRKSLHGQMAGMKAAAAAAIEASASADGRTSPVPRTFSPVSMADSLDDEVDQFGGMSIRAENLAELTALKKELGDGGLSHIGTVSQENFERLKGKDFGSDAIVKLTRMEHLLRYDEFDDDDATAATSSADSKPAAAKSTQIQIQMMQMERDSIEQEILSRHSLEDLARFKSNTEKHIALLGSMNALKKVAYYRDGGQFMDILIVHRDVINQCIASGGGWSAALDAVQNSNSVTADTSHWPDFFRVKVLEYYRTVLDETVQGLRSEVAQGEDKIAAVVSEHESAKYALLSELEIAKAEIEELKNSKRKGLKKGAAAALMEKSAASAADESASASATRAPTPETRAPELVAPSPLPESANMDVSETSVPVDQTATVDLKIKLAQQKMQLIELASPALAPIPPVASDQCLAASPEQALLAKLHPAFDALVIMMLKHDSVALCVAESIGTAVASWRKMYLEDAAESLVEAVQINPSSAHAEVIHAMLELVEMPQCASIPREVDEIGRKLEACLALIDEQGKLNNSDASVLAAQIYDLQNHIREMEAHEDEQHRFFDEQIQEMQEGNQEAQRELKSSHTIMVVTLREEAAARRSELQSRHDILITELKEQHEAKIADLVEQHAAELSKLKQQLAELEGEKLELQKELHEEENYSLRERLLVEDMRKEIEKEHDFENKLQRQILDYKKRCSELEAQTKAADQEAAALRLKIASTPAQEPPEELRLAMERMRSQIADQRKGYNELEGRWRSAVDEIKQLRLEAEAKAKMSEAVVAEASAAAASSVAPSESLSMDMAAAAAASTGRFSPFAPADSSGDSPKVSRSIRKFKSIAVLSKEMAEARQSRLEKDRLDESVLKERQVQFEKTVAERVAVVIKAMTPHQAECGTQTAPFTFHGVMSDHVTAGGGGGGASLRSQPNQSFLSLMEDDSQSLDSYSLSASIAAGGRPFVPSEDDDAEHAGQEEAITRYMWSSELPPALPLPHGFALVHVDDQQLELCPGVFLAAPSRLKPWERPLVPKNVMYCHRGTDVAYSKGIKRLPRYVKAPRLEATEAVLVPPQFEIVLGVTIIQGFRTAQHIELDPDIFLVKLDKGVHLPLGMTRVELLPKVNVPPALRAMVPAGKELVQSSLALNLPPGVSVSRGVTIAELPPKMVLPFNLSLVEREEGADFPPFMVPLDSFAVDESEHIVHKRLTVGCVVVKKPQGIVFLPGMEIIARPPGQAMPPGMSLVPAIDYPEGLVLPSHLDLVMLSPRLDLPDGCLVAEGWRAYPRPDGIVIPAGAGLFQYDGEHGGAGLLPPFMKALPMPDLPRGVTLPVTVLLAEFMPGLNQPLPVGSVLAPGITVLPMEGYAKQSQSALPCNAVIVRREPGSVLPLTVERGSRSDLPSGILLEPNVEVHLLCVRFVLPAGVRPAPGVVLGRGVQLAPGTILNRDLEVLEWPWGVTLSPGTELVHMLPGLNELPHGYHQAAIQPSLALNPHYTAHSHGSRDSPRLVVKLPPRIDALSAQQLADAVEVVDVEQAVDRREAELAGVIKGARDVFDAKVLLEALGPGMVIINKHKRGLLPPELELVPKVKIPEVLRRFCAKRRVAVRKQVRDIKEEARGGAERVMEVVQCRATHRMPPGAELAAGLVVLAMPHWLRARLPQYQWIEMVPADVLARTPTWAPLRVQVAGITSAMQPPNTAFVIMPSRFSPHTWGPLCLGLEAVICPDNVFLPPGHFLVQRPRRHEPPFSLGMGFSSAYHAFESSFPSFPPGMEVMHLHPYFALPLSVALESTAPLALLPAQPERDRGISSTLQLAEGQTLSPGVTVLAHPYAFFPFIKPGPPRVFVRTEETFLLPPGAADADATDVPAEVLEGCFASVDPTDGVNSSSGVRLLQLPRSLPTPRDRLRDPRDKHVSTGDVHDQASAGGLDEEGEEDELEAEEQHEASAIASRANTVGDVSKWLRGSFLIRAGDSEELAPFMPTLESMEERERPADRDIIYVHSTVALPVQAPPGLAGAGSAQSQAQAQAQAQPQTQTEAQAQGQVVNPANAPFRPVEDEAPQRSQSQNQNELSPDAYMRQMSAHVSGKSVTGPSISVRSAVFGAPAVLISLGETGQGQAQGPGHDPSQPSQGDLLAALEIAQDEIYSLELENNRYRKECKEQKSALGRQLKKIERLEERQTVLESSNSEWLEKSAELEGKVSLAQSQLKLKADEVAKLKNASEDAKRRLQVQVDVLTKQLALWMDANDAVLKERHVFLQQMQDKQREHYRKLALAFGTMKRHCDGVIQTSLASVCVAVASLLDAAQKSHRAALDSTGALASFLQFTKEESKWNLHRMLPADSDLARYANSNASVSGSSIATFEDWSAAGGGGEPGAGGAPTVGNRSPLPPLGKLSAAAAAAAAAASAAQSPSGSQLLPKTLSGASWAHRVTDSSTGAEAEVTVTEADELFPLSSPAPRDVPPEGVGAGGGAGVGDNGQGEGQGEGEGEGEGEGDDAMDDVSILSDISQHSLLDSARKPEHKTFRGAMAGRGAGARAGVGARLRSVGEPETASEAGAATKTSALYGPTDEFGAGAGLGGAPRSRSGSGFGYGGSPSRGGQAQRPTLPVAVWPRPQGQTVPPLQSSAASIASHYSFANANANANANNTQTNSSSSSSLFVEDLRDEFLMTAAFNPETQSAQLLKSVGAAVAGVYEAVLEEFFGEDLSAADRQLFVEQGRAAAGRRNNNAAAPSHLAALMELQKNAAVGAGGDDTSSADAGAGAGAGAVDGVLGIVEQNAAAMAALQASETLRQDLAKAQHEQPEPGTDADKPSDAASVASGTTAASAPLSRKLTLNITVAAPPIEPQKPPLPTSVSGLLAHLEAQAEAEAQAQAQAQSGPSSASVAASASLAAQLSSVQSAVTVELSGWASYVERLVQTFAEAEQARYSKALGLAETEVRVMLKERTRADKRLNDLELMLIRLQQKRASSGGDPGVQEASLRGRIVDLEDCVDRLRSAAPYGSVKAFLHANAQKIVSLQDMDALLQRQAQGLAQQAAAESAKVTLGSGSVQPLAEAERRAVLQRATALNKEAQALRDRATYCRQEAAAVTRAILQDLEDYQRIAQGCLPRRVVLDMLSWSVAGGGGNVRAGDAHSPEPDRRADDAAAAVAVASSASVATATAGAGAPLASAWPRGGDSVVSIRSHPSLTSQSALSQSQSQSALSQSQSLASGRGAVAVGDAAQKLEAASKVILSRGGATGQPGGLQSSAPGRFVVPSPAPGLARGGAAGMGQGQADFRRR